MERIFQILAAILAGVAAFFMWKGNADGAFVSAVLGAVCFFLSIRFQVKERNRQRALEAETNHEQLTGNLGMENRKQRKGKEKHNN